MLKNADKRLRSSLGGTSASCDVTDSVRGKSSMAQKLLEKGCMQSSDAENGKAIEQVLVFQNADRERSKKLTAGGKQYRLVEATQHPGVRVVDERGSGSAELSMKMQDSPILPKLYPLSSLILIDYVQARG